MSLHKNFKSHKKTKWLIPFIESVQDLVPTNKLISLKGYKISKTKEVIKFANCLKYSNGKYAIHLCLYQYDYRSAEYKGLFMGNILETFGHELAHLKVWDHSADHMKYTGLILSRFAKVLKAQKIDDTYKKLMKYE